MRSRNDKDDKTGLGGKHTLDFPGFNDHQMVSVKAWEVQRVAMSI